MQIIVFLFFVLFISESFCIVTLDVAAYGGGAEMKKGDVLNKINDTRIKNAHQFYNFIACCKVGEMLTVMVIFFFKADFLFRFLLSAARLLYAALCRWAPEDTRCKKYF